MATNQDTVEEVQFYEVSENNKLHEAERIKLVTFIKEKKCLRANEKYSREEKQAALTELEEVFDFVYTSTELMSVWKSLRTWIAAGGQVAEKGAWKQVCLEILSAPFLDRHRY